MKKIIFLILFIWAVSPAFAQTVKFGISGGLNESLFSLQNNTNNNNSSLAGFHAGIFSDIDFSKLTIEPGLFFTTKGENNKVVLDDQNAENGGGSGMTAISKLKLNYLELPINFLYNIKVKGGKFFVGEGPYFAYALSGKSKATVTTTQSGVSSTTYTEYNETFGSDGLKRFDFGIGAKGGFELTNGLSISAGYEHGLTGIESSSDNKTKNSVLMVSLGYAFQ